MELYRKVKFVGLYPHQVFHILIGERMDAAYPFSRLLPFSLFLLVTGMVAVCRVRSYRCVLGLFWVCLQVEI